MVIVIIMVMIMMVLLDRTIMMMLLCFLGKKACLVMVGEERGHPVPAVDILLAFF